MEFTIFCVESLSERLNISAKRVYKKIIVEFSRVTGKDLEESMDYFYNSITYDLISNGIGDMHCRGVKYLTDELLIEYGMMSLPKGK